jgi:sulfite exporter TauE/SafE
VAGDLIALCAAVLGASLLGSLHCAGMCGGLVAFASGAADEGPGGGLVSRHAAYHGGRLAAYAALGAAAGALGGALDFGGKLLGVQRTAALLAGLFVAIWGGHAFLTALGVRLPQPTAPAPLRRAVGRGLDRFARRPAVERALAVGLLSALLPCGWLWAYVAVAAGTGGPATGAAVMAVFWAGTVPALVAVGAFVQAASGRLRRIAPAVCAAVLVVVGLTTVVLRASAPPPGEEPSCHAGP